MIARHRAAPNPAKTDEAATEAAPADPPAAKPRPKPASNWFDRRWLPDQTRLVASVRTSRLAAQPDWNQLREPLEAWWEPTTGSLLRGLGLKPDQVERVTWAATDLGVWSPPIVAVVQLEEGQDAAKLLPAGENVDLGLPAVTFRHVAGAWPHPFAAVDERTIVTGSEPLLRELIARGEAHLASTAVERLLKSLSPENDVAVVLDLGAARAARWKLPAASLDVWPAGRKAWHLLWEIPDGLACSAQFAAAMQSELALACEGATSADKVRSAMDELVPAVKASLPATIASLTENLQAGRLKAAAAERYKFLLDESTTAIQTAHWDTTDAVVWLKLHWGKGPVAVAAAAADSVPAIRADWLAAARTADEANHARLLAGLNGHAKAEKEYPAGAMGGGLMPPETRLSWIAALLPYYGHLDWHQQLETGYNWNDARNQRVTRRVLPEVVNPVLGPGATEAGFPVTHYVGVAGVGAEAARADEKDPHVGMFGFGRTTRPEDITDGASNTIAILGVTDRPGPWAAGGDATVRALTRRPYVNGPDGFGSGQPDGMVVGMADGAVRFVSKDIDPEVMERLATIHGHEPVDVALLDPKPVRPVKPDPAPAEVKPKPEEPPAKPNPKPDAPVAKPPMAAVPPVDVQARLRDPIPEIELPEMPLVQAIDVLRSMSTLPISFDPDALQELGVSLRDSASVKLSATTVGDALDAIVSRQNLAFVVQDGQVLITSPEPHRTAMKEIRYTVADLTGRDPGSAAELAGMIQKLVVPESWQSNGGRGTVETSGDALVVRQAPSVHYHILVFCEKLRVARGLPLRSRLDPQRFALATRVDQARPMLDRILSAGIREPVPLEEVLAKLKGSEEAEIVLDRPALAAAGLAGVKATVTADRKRLVLVLGQVLDPLDLAWRVVDAGTIQVSTRKAVAARLELEFYKVGHLLGDQPPAALIARIKGRLPGVAWNESGGPGVLVYDAPSQCLIVLQSQPVQIAIETGLAGK
jgi:hypothetical protein